MIYGMKQLFLVAILAVHCYAMNVDDEKVDTKKLFQHSYKQDPSQILGSRSYLSHINNPNHYEVVNLQLKENKTFTTVRVRYYRGGIGIWDAKNNKWQLYDWNKKTKIDIGTYKLGRKKGSNGKMDRELLTIEGVKRQKWSSKSRKKIELSPIMDNYQSLFAYDSFKHTMLTHFVNTKLKLVVGITGPVDIREILNTANQSKIEAMKDGHGKLRYDAAQRRMRMQQPGHRMSDGPKSQIGQIRGAMKQAAGNLKDMTTQFMEERKAKKMKEMQQNMNRRLDNRFPGGLADFALKFTADRKAKKVEAELVAQQAAFAKKNLAKRKDAWSMQAPPTATGRSRSGFPVPTQPTSTPLTTRLQGKTISSPQPNLPKAGGFPQPNKAAPKPVAAKKVIAKKTGGSPQPILPKKPVAKSGTKGLPPPHKAGSKLAPVVPTAAKKVIVKKSSNAPAAPKPAAANNVTPKKTVGSPRPGQAGSKTKPAPVTPGNVQVNINAAGNNVVKMVD